jgi:thioesterase domain-containing protein
MAQQLSVDGRDVAELVLISSYHPQFMLDDDLFMIELFSWIHHIPLKEGGLDLGVVDEMTEFSKMASALPVEKRTKTALNELFKAEFGDRRRMELDQLLLRSYEIAIATNDALKPLTYDQFRDKYDIFKFSTLALPDYQIQPYAGSINLLKPKEATYLAVGSDREIVSYWEGLSEKGLHLHEVPGHHLNCKEEPNVAILARTLKGILNRNDA